MGKTYVSSGRRSRRAGHANHPNTRPDFIFEIYNHCLVKNFIV